MGSIWDAAIFVVLSFMVSLYRTLDAVAIIGCIVKSPDVYLLLDVHYFTTSKNSPIDRTT
jgi:hypothetical protein